jgi:uncharacterized damage-inducible protein DinB
MEVEMVITSDATRHMTATKEHLQNMFDYVRWADGQVLAASRTVPDEGYYKDQGISIGSIHKLLVHCMSVQWIWLSRWRGENPTRIENHEDWPTRDSLLQRWPLVHSAITDFLGTTSQKQLSRDVQYRNTRGELSSLPLGDLMLHVIDHATYHRGQLNTMIKRAGGTPANISFHGFCNQKRKGL